MKLKYWKTEKSKCREWWIYYWYAITSTKKIKDKVISDEFHLLFGCTETCPLCDVPFYKTHLGQLDLDSQHCSRCHRPIGFACYTPNKGGTFIASTCNDFVKSDHPFQNADTNYEFVHYKDYKTFSDYYKSWHIYSVTSDDTLYWKYIINQVTKNFNNFFLLQKLQK